MQDLLTLSRLDSGRSEMNMARFPFSAAIDSVLRSTELEARRPKHELTHDYTENLPLIMGCLLYTSFQLSLAAIK